MITYCCSCRYVNGGRHGSASSSLGWSRSISFSLATDEVCSLDQPEQVFLFVHRMTYFPLVLDRVQRYLSRFIDQRAGHGSAEIWLEDENGMPIQWHYPVGVLYDIAMAPSSMTGGPWPITVHFRAFLNNL